jgi:hypothetical protein
MSALRAKANSQRREHAPQLLPSSSVGARPLVMIPSLTYTVIDPRLVFDDPFRPFLIGKGLVASAEATERTVASYCRVLSAFWKTS